MSYRSKWFQLGLAAALCICVLLMPRPEGTRFTIKGDGNRAFLPHITDHFQLVDHDNNPAGNYTVEVTDIAGENIEYDPALNQISASLSCEVEDGVETGICQ